MENQTDIKLNNKGLSLIELLIVVAIMTIIGGTLFLSTSVATNRHVTSCANKISTAIEQTRGLTLGKQSGKIKFWMGSDGQIYAQIYIDTNAYGDQVAIGHTGLSVSFVFADTSSPSTLTTCVLDSSGAEIEFSRSTGGIIKQTVGAVSFDPGSKKLKQIIVTNGSKETIIDVDTYTGRVNVN